MSFIYPRTVNITRPNVTPDVGIQSYQGLYASQETVVLSNLPAAIQHISLGKRSDANLPSDTQSSSTWNIFFMAANGSVNDRDVITDDLGIRYQVTVSYWNSLGYKCECERLET